jgi:hypothetical protein
MVSCGVKNPVNQGVKRGQAVYWYCIKPWIDKNEGFCIPDIKDMIVLFAGQRFKFLYLDIETSRFNEGHIITGGPNPWHSVQHLWC